MEQPALSFFCELPGDELTKLFDGRFVIDDLRDLDATLCLGILDLSEARANVVQRLNKAGVPVIAWLLLPEEDGYWFNAENYEQAAERYVTFKAWTEQYDLTWAGVGLDIEPNINDMRSLTRKEDVKPILAKTFHRYTNKQQFRKAQRAFQALIDLIQADGYEVESYQIPLIIEDRKAKATVIQRTLGLVDIDVEREVLMLYSSFFRPDGAALLWSYAPDADSIGVGSTGGGVDIEGVIDLDPLSWDEFSRDLRLCVMQGKPIHIFSLEGCVEQGFLSKLSTFTWDDPTDVPGKSMVIRAGRTGIASLLWILERPWVILLALASIIGLGFLFKQSEDNKE
ncbi:MAG: hypothetical protein P1P73_08930 [Brevefilum sp.]|nr:hypothetical protein [Brevefilum sp.]